jgi:hypothetical protein
MGEIAKEEPSPEDIITSKEEPQDTERDPNLAHLKLLLKRNSDCDRKNSEQEDQERSEKNKEVEKLKLKIRMLEQERDSLKEQIKHLSQQPDTQKEQAVSPSSPEQQDQKGRDPTQKKGQQLTNQ